MKFKETVVKNEEGIQAKKAAELVNLCSRFDCEINLKQGSKNVNAKSIMGVISMALKEEDCVTIIVDGADEDVALQEVVKFFN